MDLVARVQFNRFDVLSGFPNLFVLFEHLRHPLKDLSLHEPVASGNRTFNTERLLYVLSDRPLHRSHLCRFNLRRRDWLRLLRCKSLDFGQGSLSFFGRWKLRLFWFIESARWLGLLLPQVSSLCFPETFCIQLSRLLLVIQVMSRVVSSARLIHVNPCLFI